MSVPSILPPDDDPVSFPSMPTLHGGDPDALGRIDHYDLLRKLGGGGFGVVYLAKDSNSGVEVALKTLHPLLKTNAEEMDALREKFALVSRLTHTNIAKALVLNPVRDLNIWDETARKEMRLSPGDSVMVMDYAPGVTLSRWRRQFPDGVVPLDLALEIARQVASALDYAHGERIVHRDIKPGNIMVETLGDNAQCRMHNAQCNAQGGASRPGEPPLVTRHPSLVTSKLRVRLLDFGLAAEIRSSMSRVSTETGDTSGTRPYMAPEQWLGKKQDGRTDQYALACVLYEMLSGAPPFAGVFETGDPMIMKDAVVRDAPEELEGVSPAVNAALLRALAKTPKERFPSCAEFVAALEETTKDTKYTKADDGRDAPTARPDGVSRPGKPPNAAALEADVLRRKLAMTRAIKVVSAEDRTDSEFSGFITKAEDELAVAEEACKLGRFAAAVESLAASGMALDELQTARHAREEAKRKAKEEAERKAREEAERKAREEAERKIAEEKARREAERKVEEERTRSEDNVVQRETPIVRHWLLSILGLAVVMVVGTFYFTKSERSGVENGSSGEIAREGRRFVVGFDADFPPYGFKDGNEFKGFDLDLAREVCKRKGWTFVAKPIDWDAKDTELNAGSIDCIWNAFTMATERLDKYAWTVPYAQNKQIVIVRSDSGIKTFADLKGKTVAVLNGSAGAEAMENKLEEAKKTDAGFAFRNLKFVPDNATAFQMLRSGVVNALGLEADAAAGFVKENGGMFSILDEVLMDEQFAVAFKLGNESMRDEVQTVLFEMAADGTAAKIVARWAEEEISHGGDLIDFILKP